MSANVSQMEPNQLLTAKRFDVIAKYLYVRYKNMGLHSNWADLLYREHIRVFNGCVEADGSEKYGADSFVSAFDSVIESIKQDGFSPEKPPIPIDIDGVILDGAHRLAACLYYKSPLSVEKMMDVAPEYNYKYFIERGLSSAAADAIAVEYCRIEENTFVPIIYPSAQGKDSELISILSKYGDILYSKEVYLSGEGPLNLIRQIYHSEPWLGSYADGFSGAKNKTLGCFQEHGAVRVFIVKSNLEDMLLAKNEIRDLFGISNHSVHINDTHDESVELSNILFNANSIHFMNHSRIVNFKWFQNLLNEYRAFIENNDIDGEYLCVDGSAIMAAYGIREARDLDYLHHGYDDVESGYKEIGSHNHSADLYANSIDDIIFNPANYFYCDGLKFATLDILKKMKVKRGEDKDSQDVMLIDDFLKGITPKKSLKNWKVIFKSKFWYVKIRFMALKVRFYLYKLLKNIK